jgi:hypothetical protein
VIRYSFVILNLFQDHKPRFVVLKEVQDNDKGWRIGALCQGEFAMKSRSIRAAALIPLLLLTACAASDAPAPTAASYASALADPARFAADRERDAVRKPAELLAFAQIAPGEQVGDFVMGGGYLTRVIAAAVGPTGGVHAFQPAEFIAFRKEYGTEQSSTVASRAK